MNLTLFNTHSLAGRLEIILEQGTFLAERGRRGYHIELYNMGNFFAEVWTNPETNFIGLIRGLGSNRALEPYVAKVNLMDMIYG